jgi:hypothetical protein
MARNGISFATMSTEKSGCFRCKLPKHKTYHMTFVANTTMGIRRSHHGRHIFHHFQEPHLGNVLFYDVRKEQSDEEEWVQGNGGNKMEGGSRSGVRASMINEAGSATTHVDHVCVLHH